MSEYKSIVTHNDFDGLGSAAILSWAFGIDDIRFAGPITIANAQISITREDIVSDLPYPLECGLWFDHHAGNLEEIKLRGIDPATIAGKFAVEPSCIRVVYDYFAEQGEELPEDFSELADVGDVIDSFNYPSMDAWRADTPAHRIDRAIKASSGNRYEHEKFLRELTFMMRDLSLTEIANDSLIKTRSDSYEADEQRMLENIAKYSFKLPEDSTNELLFVDFLSFINPVRIDKKLIGLLYPEAKGYVELKPSFQAGKKTNNITVTLSLALNMQQNPHTKDMGEIVRLLNIGDGHTGAAAGVYRCNSAHEYQLMRE